MESGDFKERNGMGVDGPRSETKRGGRGLEAALRVLALVLTLAAAIVMGVNKQSKMISFGLINILATAKSSYLSAFVYLVVANSIASAIAALTLLITLVRSQASALKMVIDMIMVALLFSATGAAAAVGLLGYKGNSHVMWNKVCDQFGKFCHNVMISLFLSLLASIVYFLLVLLALHKLRRN